MVGFWDGVRVRVGFLDGVRDRVWVSGFRVMVRVGVLERWSELGFYMSVGSGLGVVIVGFQN